MSIVLCEYLSCRRLMTRDGHVLKNNILPLLRIRDHVVKRFFSHTFAIIAGACFINERQNPRRLCSLSREKVSIPLDKDGTSLRAYFTHMVKATRFGGSDQFFCPFPQPPVQLTRASAGLDVSSCLPVSESLVQSKDSYRVLELTWSRV